MTYLTRIGIDPTSRGAMPYLASPHRFHGALLLMLSSAPHGSAGQGRVLWRLDSFPTSTWLYVVGPEKPNTAALHEEAGLPARPPESKEYAPRLEGLADGGRYRFRLAGNVTKAAVDVGSPNRSRPELTRGKRVAITDEAGQLAWLDRQGELHGFSVERDPQGVPQVRLGEVGSKRFSRDKATVTLNKVRFDGVLTVHDADALRAALVSGIGRGKAYGLGLLTLAPAGS